LSSLSTVTWSADWKLTVAVLDLHRVQAGFTFDGLCFSILQHLKASSDVPLQRITLDVLTKFIACDPAAVQALSATLRLQVTARHFVHTSLVAQQTSG
jgi:hypothetical protein